MEVFLGIVGIIACLWFAFLLGAGWFILQLNGVFGGKSTGEHVLTWVLPCGVLGLLYFCHRILAHLYH